MFAISDEISLVFSTPLLLRMVPGAAALNEGLERAILKRREQSAGNRISNIGGWQSLPDLLDWPEPEVKMLAGELDRAIQRISAVPAIVEQRGAAAGNRVGFQAYGWANVNEFGDYNSMHMHPGSDWSAVYYVCVGIPAPGDEKSGRLELRDPRPAAAFARTPGFEAGKSLLIGPTPGLMVVFPAWIEHFVHPFKGEGRRISIAINVKIETASRLEDY